MRPAEIGSISTRILVVEDDRKIASFVLKGLKEAGFALDHADNGDDALQLAIAEPYDVAVLDIVLPKLDCGKKLRNVAGAATRRLGGTMIEFGRVTAAVRQFFLQDTLGLHYGARIFVDDAVVLPASRNIPPIWKVLNSLPAISS